MNKVQGLHHIAVSTADIKAQIEFFTDKLGMELVALYWMHGVENTWHGFLRLGDESSIAFVQNPDIESLPPNSFHVLMKRVTFISDTMRDNTACPARPSTPRASSSHATRPQTSSSRCTTAISSR